MAQGGTRVFSAAHNKTGWRSADCNEIFSNASRAAVGRKENVSKIAAGRGEARPGGARRGQAVRCKAKQGEVDSKHPAISVVGWNGGNSYADMRGMAMPGVARQGKAKQGKAIF